jgi:hypothetical protein
MHLGFIGLGILEFFLVLFLAPLALLAFAFWIWMLVHAITNNGLTDIEKLIWVIVILFTHFIGAVIYFFVGRPKRRMAS